MLFKAKYFLSSPACSFPSSCPCLVLRGLYLLSLCHSLLHFPSFLSSLFPKKQAFLNIQIHPLLQTNYFTMESSLFLQSSPSTRWSKIKSSLITKLKPSRHSYRGPSSPSSPTTTFPYSNIPESRSSYESASEALLPSSTPLRPTTSSARKHGTNAYQQSLQSIPATGTQPPRSRRSSAYGPSNGGGGGGGIGGGISGTSGHWKQYYAAQWDPRPAKKEEGLRGRREMLVGKGY